MSNATVHWNAFTDYYHFLFTELADPRTNDWFLVKHPVIFPIVGLYIYLVTKVGPRLMQNRAAFEFKNTLVVYNAIQVGLSVWMFWEALTQAYWNRYSWKCEPVDYSDNPHALRVCRGVYVFYLAKISELLDTFFFVLRKKNKQVSFLHLYHHACMPMVSWGVVKYFAGGHSIFCGFINSFVHIIMYTYYMLAAMGPHMQKYLWWKKYITNLQMIQFCLGFLHSSQLLFYDCGYPRWSMFFTLPNAVFFYYLFADFYNQAYKKDKREKSANGCENINGKTIADYNNIKYRKNGLHAEEERVNGQTYHDRQNGYHQKTR